ncbi:apolipoprotein N-acyltransferase [Gemmatimonadota bacterium]
MATAGNGTARLRLLVASALLLTLAQPPFPTGWLAYVGLVPYLVGLEGLRGRRAFGYGFTWGFTVNLLGLYWIAFVKVGALAAAVLYLALLDGLFTLLLARLRPTRRALMLPFLWTGFLFVKSAGQMGFPWLTLGLTQTWSPAAIQLAAVGGAWMVDLWVAGVNGLVYRYLPTALNALHKRDGVRGLRAFGPALGLALAVLLYGHLTMALGGASASERFHALAEDGAAERGEEASTPDERPAWIPAETAPLRVAAVQGSVRPTVKLAPQLLMYNLYLYRRLSRAALAAAPEELDLLVWPETAVPQYLTHSLSSRRELAAIQQSLAIPILTGAFAATRDPEADGGYRNYNAAFLVDSGVISTEESIYRKRILVPFGERVPYQKLFGFLQGLNLGWSNFSLGADRHLFGGSPDSDLPPVAVQICYESIFARLVRPQVVDGAQVLCVITNDAWFGRTSGPYQHLRAAALRAVEFRRPVIRAANSGVSGFVDRWGQVHQATPLYTKTAVVGRVWPEEGLTLYARMGDWLPWLTLLIALAGQILFRAAPVERPSGSTAS